MLVYTQYKEISCFVYLFIGIFNPDTTLSKLSYVSFISSSILFYLNGIGLE